MGRLTFRPPVPRLDSLIARGNDLGGCARIATSRQANVRQQPQQDHPSSGRISITEDELDVAMQRQTSQESSTPISSRRISIAQLPLMQLQRFMKPEAQPEISEREPSKKEAKLREVGESEMEMIDNANSCRPNTTGSLEKKRSTKKVSVAPPRTARAATTTPSRSWRRANSREGSPGSASLSRNENFKLSSPRSRSTSPKKTSPREGGEGGWKSESTKEFLSGEHLDESDVVRKRARLLELMDSAYSDFSRSTEPVLDDESRPAYQKFLCGYIDTSAQLIRRRTLLEESVSKLVGEEYNELSSRNQSNVREDMDDHYKFFSRQKPSISLKCHCKEDNDRRLQRIRLQALAARVALSRGASPNGNPHVPLAWSPGADSAQPRSRLTNKPRKGWEKAGVQLALKHEDTQQMLECFERAASPDSSDHGQDINALRRNQMLKKQGLRQTMFTDDGDIFNRRCRANRGKLQELKTQSHFSANTAAVAKELKSEMRTREACESLRFLVFGYISESKRSNGPFYEQACGSRDEVLKLHSIWNQIDEDGSGDIEFTEFLSYFSKSKADRLLGMKCVKYLVGNGNDATSCNIEDMMKLIWLKATKADVDSMMHWFKEAEYHRFRAPSPPLLPKRKRREILENFPSLELGAKISYADLVETGLVDEPTAKQLQHQYDKENTNVITVAVLLDMMCPNGYRSRKDATTAVDNDGRMLEYINNEFFTGWIFPAKRGGDSDREY